MSGDKKEDEKEHDFDSLIEGEPELKDLYTRGWPNKYEF